MAQTWRCWFWKLGQVSFLVVGYAIASFGDCALAQVTPDSTWGAESSVVTPQAPGSPVDVIEGGATRGANLFHSFEQFSIPTGSEAFFNNALDIQNIISRVTALTNGWDLFETLCLSGIPDPEPAKASRKQDNNKYQLEFTVRNYKYVY